MPPTPTPVDSIADVRAFFDRFAPRNTEQHGTADALLRYRVGLLKHYGRFTSNDTVLDLGCGDGNHLRMLASDIDSGIGIDVSPAMVQSARRAARALPNADHLSFQVDDARTLATISRNSVDCVICVGALEHMMDPGSVLHSVHRVLRPGGRFVALTLNGGYVWYRWVAPMLRIPTRHLETDRRLTAATAHTLLRRAGFARIALDYWTFVPRGDMPAGWPPVWDALDLLGRWLNCPALRGGLVLAATAPASDTESGL